MKNVESRNEQEPKRENFAMVSTSKAKDFQMHQFLSQGAAQMVQDSANSPETYIVQKNVKEVDTVVNQGQIIIHF